MSAIFSQNVVEMMSIFGQDLTAIVITGPNTGGKTIMLKTLGLTQVVSSVWRLPILADEKSRWYFWKKSLLILGMSNLLSRACHTFSSHMTNIVDILGRRSTSIRSYVTDELGLVQI